MKSSSPGYDNIPISVFKHNFDFIGPVVTGICYRGLTSGIFPNRLKIDKIKCIIKESSLCDFNSYRPISNFPAFGEILEIIVFDQVYHDFTVNNLFTEKQFGFRKQMSTESDVLDSSDHILSNFDRGKYTVATFSDLSKTFDTLNRLLLILKSRCYGVNGRALEFIR